MGEHPLKKIVGHPNSKIRRFKVLISKNNAYYASNSCTKQVCCAFVIYVVLQKYDVSTNLRQQRLFSRGFYN